MFFKVLALSIGDYANANGPIAVEVKTEISFGRIRSGSRAAPGGDAQWSASVYSGGWYHKR